MGAYLELLVRFVIQLFIIVDPLACIPLFLAITPSNTRGERRILARRGCLIAFIVLVFFLLAGAAIIGYFGIAMPAIQICGGMLLFLIALEYLHGHPTKTETTFLEERLAGEKEDVSVTPLAIPLLAGPGAIATTLVFAGRAENVLSYAILAIAAAIVFAAVYACLHWADSLARIIGVLGMKVITRIMGFLLAFIGIQYVIDGIREQFLRQ